MDAQIGEAAARRHTAPIASATLWALLWGVGVIIAHAVSPHYPARAGSYRTGIETLTVFALAALYPLRKYAMWFSLRWLHIATKLPRPIALRMLLFDRLETWRTVHLTLGVFAMLPFWWHTEAGPASLLEEGLKTLVILLVLSGFIGTMIEEFLPLRMLQLGNSEVRTEDVEASFHQLYVEAEEMVLGHSEALVNSYLKAVRPVLLGSQPQVALLWATLAGHDPTPATCSQARTLASNLGNESTVFNVLVDIAERKIRLEQNLFNLRVGWTWMRIHRSLAASVALLIAFHIAGVLYFAGV